MIKKKLSSAIPPPTQAWSSAVAQLMTNRSLTCIYSNA